MINRNRFRLKPIVGNDRPSRRYLSLKEELLLAMAPTLTMLFFFGAGYTAGAVAMVVTIVFMIVLNIVHPPAVATSLSFAFRVDRENNFILFSLAVGVVALLDGLERFVLWLLARSAIRRIL